MSKIFKAFLVIFSVLFIVLFCSENHASAYSIFSLISNSGFEDDADSDGVPDGWSPNIWAGTGTTSIDNTEKKSGSYSVKMTGTSVDAHLKYTSTDQKIVVPNSTYEYSVYIKTESLLPGYASFKTAFKDASGNVIEEDESDRISETSVSGTVYGWEYVSKQIVTPDNVATVCFSVELTGMGTVWFDDVDIEQKAVFDLLANGSAEKDANPANGEPDNWYVGGYEKNPVLVNNPGFEDGISSPADWNIKYWAGTTQDMKWTWDNSVSMSGMRSLAVEGLSNDVQAGWASTTIPINPSDPYTYKANIKTENVTGQALMLITFYKLNDDGKYSITGSQIEMNAATGTHDWELVELLYRTPANAVKVRLDLRIYGTGKAWFDDISIDRTEWTINPLFSTQELTTLPIINPGFEDGKSSPADWSTKYWAGTTQDMKWTWDNTVSMSGMRSLAVEGLSNDVQAGWASTTIPINPSDTYTYKANIKTENVTGQALMLLTFYKLNDNGTYSITGSQIEMNAATGTHDWELVTLSYITPSNAVMVRLDLRLYGTGKVWFDDISAVKTEWIIDPSYSSFVPLPVSNPGFEDGTSSPDDWSEKYWAGTTQNMKWTWDNSVSMSGMRSLAVEGLSNDVQAGWASIRMPVNKGETYTYNAYIKTEDVTGQALMLLTFYKLNDNGTYSIVGNQIEMNAAAGTHDWELVTLSYITPSNAVMVRLDLRLYGTGKAWFDDISVDTTKVRTAQAAWDSAEKYDGKYSLKINSNDANGGVQWSSDDITVMPEEFYSYSCYIKTENVSNKAIINFVFKNANGAVIKEVYSNSLAGTVTSWTEVSGVVQAPLNAASVRVDLRVYGSGTAWFDTIKLNKNSFNRLLNPGIEYSNTLDSTQPAGWTNMVWSGTDSQVTRTWDSSISHTSEKSLSVSINEPIAKGGYVSSKYPVFAGKTYKFSAYIKTKNVAECAILHLEYYDSNNSVIKRVDSNIISGTTDWTKVTISYETPSNATWVRVDVRLYNTGTAWFDDLNFEGPISVHPSALYSTADLADIRAKLDTEPFLSRYNYQKTLSDRYTSSDLDNIATNISPWKDMMYIYTVPTGATKARFEIKLCGKGSVWLDYMQLLHGTIGINEDVPNYNFEDGSPLPDYWSEKTWAGNPVICWDNIVSFKSSNLPGTRSLKITNDSSDDKGGLVSTFEKPVVAGDSYTSKIKIREDSLLEDGVYINMVFLDDNGAVVGEALSKKFNRLTSSLWSNVVPGAYYDADVYLKESNTMYAEKAKKRLIYAIDDMIAGMKYRMQHNGADPDGTYGAIHMGRAVTAVSIIYDMIKDSGVISEHEDMEIKTKLVWVANTLMDTSYFPYDDGGTYALNWYTKRLCGLGVFSMVFPEYPGSADWFEYTKDSIEWQLDNIVMDDGAWPESNRYQGAVLRSLITYGKVLERYDGTDFFANPKLKSMFDYYIKLQTPVDKATKFRNVIDPNKGVAVLPGIGNANWSNEWTSVLGWAAPEYAASDPELSKRMMAAWQRYGFRLDTELSPGVPLGDLIFPDPSLPSEIPTLPTEKFDNIGYVIFRQDFNNEDKEDYFIYRSSDYYGHHHRDQGSFSIYSDSTPLVLDSGCASYSDGAQYWYTSSRAHNMVAFKDANGNIKGGPLFSSITDFYTSNTIDYVQSDIPDAMAAYYHRHVYFVKDGFDAYIVWDDIDSVNNSEIGYNTLSTSTDIAGNKATAHGYNNMDVEITYLSPDNSAINKSIGGISSINGYNQNYVEHLTVNANAGDDYLTVLYGKKNTDAGLAISMLSVDKTDAAAYKINKSDGSSIVILINKGVAQDVGITIDTTLTDMRTGTVYSNSNGVTAVNIGVRSIMILSVTPQVPAPEAPVIQSAVAGDGHVNITWSEVAGSTGYAVYASTVSNSYSVPVTTVAGFVYNYDVTGLTNGMTYYFVVKATNAGGDSPYSAEVSATPKTTPGEPVNVIQSGNIATLKNSKIECLGGQPEWVWFKQGSSLKNGILVYWTPNELTTDEEKQAIINANNDPSSSRYKITDVLFFYGDGAVIKGGDGKNEYKVFKEVTTGLWYVQLIKGDLGHYRFVEGESPH